MEHFSIFLLLGLVNATGISFMDINVTHIHKFKTRLKQQCCWTDSFEYGTLNNCDSALQSLLVHSQCVLMCPRRRRTEPLTAPLARSMNRCEFAQVLTENKKSVLLQRKPRDAALNYYQYRVYRQLFVSSDTRDSTFLKILRILYTEAREPFSSTLLLFRLKFTVHFGVDPWCWGQRRP